MDCEELLHNEVVYNRCYMKSSLYVNLNGRESA